MVDDGYGSLIREEMKRSMEKTWKALNRREPLTCNWPGMVGFVLAVMAIGAVLYWLIR